MIQVQGIDISVDGIAVEADHQFVPGEPGKFHSSNMGTLDGKDNGPFSADQCVQIQELITQLSKHR